MAVFDLAQSLTETPGPAISMKGHAVIMQEPTAHLTGTVTALPQPGIGPPLGGIGINRRHEICDPIRIFTCGDQGLTNFARPVAGGDRIVRGPEELNIFELGFAGRTGRITEYTGSPYTGVENSIVGLVSIDEGRFH